MKSNIFSNWHKYRLGDLCSSVCSGGTPKSNVPEYYDGGIPWLNTKEVNFNRIYSTERTISELGFNNSAAKWIEPNTVIVAMYGATAGKVAIAKCKLTTNQACCNLSIKKDIADYQFIYYTLLNRYDELSSLANGGAQQNLNAQIIKDFEIDLPPLSVQYVISYLLGCIDSKIEHNTMINRNLEAQLMATFLQFYTSTNTSHVPLKVYCTFQEGYVNPSQNYPEYFDGSVKWLRAVDINESYIITTSRTLSYKGFTSAGKSALLFPPDSIAISKSGTIGRLGIIADQMCGNRAVINIVPHQKDLLGFIFCYLKSKQHNFNDLAVGSVQKNLYVSVLEQLEIKTPENDNWPIFHFISQNILNKIKDNCIENKTLEDLRDTLLPKLMSGEIDVSEVEV